MTTVTPSIEFFIGVPEELSNVSLRRGKETGVRNVLFSFDKIKALEKFQSFTARSANNIRLIDSEGEISLESARIELLYGTGEDEDLRGVNVSFDIEDEDHWGRFMRFMRRYAEANGMAYSDSEKLESPE